MSRAPLVFDGVWHGYGGAPVLCGLSCEIPAGVFGVLGGNGAGKSTLLKLAAGLLVPDRGRVLLGGADTRGAGVATGAAYLPESLHLDSHLTPREFLSFVAAVRGVTGDGMDLLSRLGAAAAADRLMGGLSYGMRRKVGLCAALLANAPVVVLDEPGNGLDAHGLDALEGLIRERVAAGGCVVVSTHDMAFVARLCPRMLLLRPGDSPWSGAPGALCAATGQSDLHRAFLAATGTA